VSEKFLTYQYSKILSVSCRRILFFKAILSFKYEKLIVSFSNQIIDCEIIFLIGNMAELSIIVIKNKDRFIKISN
jgi:hypothetical protein